MCLPIQVGSGSLCCQQIAAPLCTGAGSCCSLARLHQPPMCLAVPSFRLPRAEVAVAPPPLIALAQAPALAPVLPPGDVPTLPPVDVPSLPPAILPPLETRTPVSTAPTVQVRPQQTAAGHLFQSSLEHKYSRGQRALLAGLHMQPTTRSACTALPARTPAAAGATRPARLPPAEEGG